MTSLSPYRIERFGTLVRRYVPNLRVVGPRGTGLCPFHNDKNPSLSIDFERGIFHCFGCGQSGGVKKFAELVGEPWTRTSSESREEKTQRISVQAARDEYKVWQDERFNTLVAEQQELDNALADAVVVYGLLHRRPYLFVEEQARQCEQRLGALHHRLATVNNDLDILTIHALEPERLLWWKAEQEHRRVA